MKTDRIDPDETDTEDQMPEESPNARDDSPTERRLLAAG